MQTANTVKEVETPSRFSFKLDLQQTNLRCVESPTYLITHTHTHTHTHASFEEAGNAGT